MLQWRPVTSVRLVAYMWAVGGSSPSRRASGEGQVKAQRLVSYIHGAPEASQFAPGVAPRFWWR